MSARALRSRRNDVVRPPLAAALAALAALAAVPASAQVSVESTASELSGPQNAGPPIIAEYGDAPDDVNAHYAAPYGSVIGRFPTRFNTSNSRYGLTGGRTLDVSQEWLGQVVSLERGPRDRLDPDGVENFIDDDFDDGWVGGPCPTGSPAPPFANPFPVTLSFDVTVAAGAPAGPRYLNLLFDFNHDGVWSGEWVVVDAAVSVAPGTTQTITVGPFLYPVTPVGSWMRVALTRTPISGTFPDDGSGWDGSGTFSHGEIEDYLVAAALDYAQAAAYDAAFASDFDFAIGLWTDFDWDSDSDVEEIDIQVEVDAFASARAAAEASAGALAVACISCPCAFLCAESGAFAAVAVEALAEAEVELELHVNAFASARAGAIAAAGALAIAWADASAAAAAAAGAAAGALSSACAGDAEAAAGAAAAAAAYADAAAGAFAVADGYAIARAAAMADARVELELIIKIREQAEAWAAALAFAYAAVYGACTECYICPPCPPCPTPGSDWFFNGVATWAAGRAMVGGSSWVLVHFRSDGSPISGFRWQTVEYDPLGVLGQADWAMWDAQTVLGGMANEGNAVMMQLDLPSAPAPLLDDCGRPVQLLGGPVYTHNLQLPQAINLPAGQEVYFAVRALTNQPYSSQVLTAHRDQTNPPQPTHVLAPDQGVFHATPISNFVGCDQDFVINPISGNGSAGDDTGSMTSGGQCGLSRLVARGGQTRAGEAKPTSDP